MAVLVLAPSLYYYTRAFYKLSTKNFLVHVIPYQIGLGIIYFLILSGIYLVPQWFFSLYYASVLLIYLVLTVRLKKKYKLKKHQEWMKTIGIGFGIWVLLHVIEVVLINVFHSNKEQVALINTSIQNSFSCLFFIVVVRQIVTNPQPFSNSSLRIPGKNSSANIFNTELKLLLSYVEEKKAYLNPILKSAVVSEETGLSINQISEIVNSVFKKNFNEWINDFRIEEAKGLLSDTELTIKEIFYCVGFNSKSAFNTAFKSRIAMTPSEYRDKFRPES